MLQTCQAEMLIRLHESLTAVQCTPLRPPTKPDFPLSRSGVKLSASGRAGGGAGCVDRASLARFPAASSDVRFENRTSVSCYHECTVLRGTDKIWTVSYEASLRGFIEVGVV